MIHRISRGIFPILVLFFQLGAGAMPARGDEMPLDKARRIPPAGVTVLPADRAELQAGVAQLGKEIDALRDSLKGKPGIDLLADVQIFYNAVRYALTYDEFFNANEIAKAKALLNEGLTRAKELRDGSVSWTRATGLVVRGYVSKIDGSVQPYALVLPASVAGDTGRKHRLDIWYHGRGEKLNEINFLADHQKSAGEFAPPDVIVLHPYGRYCNGNRFAGEVDTFEALESVKRGYAVDDNRIFVRGFSMGGAACWMFATHHAGLWAGAAPGAGFSETAGFLHITDLSTIPWYQQDLWHWYDSTDRAVNLFNCPTVAYSGELDGQKQAADMMQKALADVGIDMTHIIGAGAHHNYVPAAKLELDRRLESIAERGRNPAPSEIRFSTYSLRYNKMFWLEVDAMEHHWQKATINARLIDPAPASNNEKLAHRAIIDVTGVENVSAFTLSFPPGLAPLKQVSVTIGGKETGFFGPITSDRSLVSHYHLAANGWTLGPMPVEGLQKSHGLQGPIDDAFMDSFIMVKPTGKPMNEKTAAWVAKEQAHAIEHWRKQFRGEARVKDDTAITDADIAGSNLVLWGDPSSNAVLAKVAARLPIHWDGTSITFGKQSVSAATHVPVLIYPNPLNPRRYIVLNSGFTFREYDYENNARQTPKLPDWAIVNVEIPPTAQSPGGIEAASFFDEHWQLSGNVPPATRATGSAGTPLQR